MPSHITTKKPLCAFVRSKHSPHSTKHSRPREQLKIKHHTKAHIIRIVGIERTHMTHTRTHATHTYTRIHAHTHHTRTYIRTHLGTRIHTREHTKINLESF